MNNFHFFKYPVYKHAKEFCIFLDPLVNKLRLEREFTYYDQLNRAKLSVVLNIAEGFSRYSQKDFARFMTIALGSLFEVVSCIDILFDTGYVDSEFRLTVLEKSEVIAKQLSTLRKSTI